MKREIKRVRFVVTAVLPAREDSLLAKTFGVWSSFSTRRGPASAGRRLVGEGGSLITALYALLVALLVCLPSTSRAQLVDSFDPNANNDVRVLAVQGDGKILVGGLFTSMGGQTRNRIALLNPDGSLDASFDPNANQGVFAVPVQADGEILVGGYFTSIGGQTRNRIAQLNPDGSLDTSFDPNANNDVRVLAVQTDGKIRWAAPSAASAARPATALRGLVPTARSTPPLIPTPTVRQRVLSLPLRCRPMGEILVGGAFSSIGGQTRNNIARLNPDGSLDATFDPNANFFVEALAMQADGKILVGGLFTSIGGQTRNSIARLNSDGSLDATFDPNAHGQVHAVAVQADGKILVGGLFTSIGGQTRNRIARLNSDGSLDASFDPNANDFVFAVAVQVDGKILVGGAFQLIGGQPRNRIARLNPEAPTPRVTPRPRPTPHPRPTPPP